MANAQHARKIAVRTAGVVYRTLHPIRGFAARRLADAGEESDARDRHVAWAIGELDRALQGRDGQPITL